MKNRKRLLTALALLPMLAMQAQVPLRTEYFLDSDPGYGKARSFFGLTVGENAMAFDLSDAPAGAHVLYVRIQDDVGHWSTTMSRPLFIESPQAQRPQRMEYFLDSDPGYGKARAIVDITEGENAMTFDLSDAPAGAHVLYVRSQDDVGRWSTMKSRPLYIEQLQDIVYVEYFIDSDPGVGKATPLPLPDIDYKAYLDFNVAINTADLELGMHELSVRACDALGQWTNVLTREFEVVEKVEPEPFGDGVIARMEYFFDHDPGYGKGIPIRKASTGEHTYEVSFDTVEPGAHLFCLRAQDEDGHWSTVLSRPIFVASPHDVVSIARMEYFFDTDPGYGKGIPLQKASTGENTYEVSFDTVEPGAHLLCLRSQGVDGRWSAVVSRPVYVINPLGIAAIEYFFDTDPGVGKGIAVSLPKDTDESFAFVAETQSLSAGEHTLYVRAKGLDGLWSYISRKTFVVAEGGLKGDVNSDGTVDVADIAAVIDVMAGVVTAPASVSAADVNGDSVVDVADIASIIDIMAANARLAGNMED